VGLDAAHPRAHNLAQIETSPTRKGLISAMSSTPKMRLPLLAAPAAEVPALLPPPPGPGGEASTEPAPLLRSTALRRAPRCPSRSTWTTTPRPRRPARARGDAAVLHGALRQRREPQPPFGWVAEEAVDYAREQVRQLLGAREPEGDRLHLGRHGEQQPRDQGRGPVLPDKGNHIVTTKTEHKAVLDTCKRLEREGFEVTYLDVDREGQVSPDDVRAAITDKTILVSVMLATTRSARSSPSPRSARSAERGVLFHTDAVQGVGKHALPRGRDERRSRLDLRAQDVRPKGVGALYVRRATSRASASPRDGRRRPRAGMRSGTLNVPGIVGLGKACEILNRRRWTRSRARARSARPAPQEALRGRARR
jgi:selenocysteine lyase/cysteine desulfurase